ncbi:MAG: glycosyltransferase family 1 protein [Rhodoferax sp.]|uniref:glycosyltransferase family 4 protein n=1 Tax=Rhodoferax sp. TaxID=50421 RepID=UPI002623A3EE|nr:glycosyltransferase family 1 protein [Rhodoferax sp.]MDD5336354.1 glycosyltransferase family 1 protein [Rhodoferax sp.]
MRIALVTDAWQPQINGVVTTLVELVRQMEDMGHRVGVIHPGLFKTRPCPGYPGIDLAIRPARGLCQMLEAMAPDAIHLATEGPLGWAARAYCVKHKLAFTTAFHSKFPEFVHAALKIPVGLGYALLRRFHKPSSGVMVPTQGVLRMLQRRGFRNLRGWTHGVDMRLFRYHEQTLNHPALSTLARPISLFVGRLSYEKNIQAFLQLDIPGSKVVCGTGPQEAVLKERYPQVRWLGILRRDQLAQVYAAADLFVFPSRTDTFGLVMLEAMACGTPVAAYPVDGPTEVVGQGDGTAKGGVLHEDLAQAWQQALALPRHEARSRALEFTWEHSTQLFLAHLVPLRKPIPVQAGVQQFDSCHTTDIN